MWPAYSASAPRRCVCSTAVARSTPASVPEVARLHAEDYGVYGVRKMHTLLRREGWDIGRDQTARLMKLAGVEGVKRSEKVLTTKPEFAQEKPRDLVGRDFTASAPNRLWVADITYVATWTRLAYVAFVIDVFSHIIVGRNVAATLRAEVQALNMAAFNATASLDELVHHADHGSNYLSVVCTEQITELSAKPSTGTVGHNYDNALAEAINRRYKTELNRRRGSDGRSSKASSQRWSTRGGGTTPDPRGNSTTTPQPRARRRTTARPNQPSQHWSDREPKRNETQTDSVRTRPTSWSSISAATWSTSTRTCLPPRGPSTSR